MRRSADASKEKTVDIRNLSSDAIGLFAAAALMSWVGWYTDNPGFLWAGSIFFVVASGLVIGRSTRKVGKGGE